MWIGRENETNGWNLVGSLSEEGVGNTPFALGQGPRDGRIIFENKKVKGAE